MCLQKQQCYRDFTLLLRFNFMYRVRYYRKLNDGRCIKEIGNKHDKSNKMCIPKQK